MAQLAGKVALITGGARGQGEAAARTFAARGAKVVLTDLLTVQGEQVAASLGADARFVRHDVSDEQGWRLPVRVALAEFGSLDVLVNNAGVYSTAWIEQESAARFRRLLEVNLLGVFFGLRAVVPAMRTGGGGSIVNVSSTAGMQGVPGHGAYGASKWAVRGLTKTAALELGEHGIRVNSVHPGAVDTEMIRGSGLVAGNGNYPKVALRRLGTPQDTAELVAFLASDAAAYLTGGEFAVDGGLVAGTAAPVRGGDPACR
ncbi:glucose 1-dehydrogenase [Solihabitans fulvus]|uniref:Glucose 1-dehydrogenase n=1 Tax=Solihabitans fulvus TaxID=1892852 RepID=A0A5B2WLA1_9PSEU|nr:glucose 1-dehydrogenase [Solihabitans fulvus]KAA2252571.1 glucose 1-dehydrogenase [Solihabitans fulvus]